MHITVAGKQVDTGEALKTHVRDGLGQVARKYFDHAIEANVTFHRDAKGRQGAFFVCDINLKAGRDIFMRAEGHGTDAHRAFDEAAEHLGKRLRRYRRRVNDHARSLADERTPRPDPEPAQERVLQHAEEEAEDAPPAANGLDHHGTVIAELPARIERLTVGEAVMRLDLGHLPVLMFRNRANGGLNVVYRRPDGNVGWIDPVTG